MASNQLNLIFGPKLPEELETVGLAFIAAPSMRPDSAIGTLSAVRYAKENYDHIEDSLPIFTDGIPNTSIQVRFESSVLASAFSSVATGGTNLVDNQFLNSSSWTIKTLNTAIKVIGLHVSQADTWYPIVHPGCVWRFPYTLSASGIEPSGSWLRKAIPNDGQDHKLILIYACPEHTYNQTTSALGLAFPPNQAKYVQMKEIATVIEPHKVSYNGKIDVLTQIKVNGTVKFSGSVDEYVSDNYLRGIDRTLKELTIKPALAPTDRVELTYYSYNDYYIYSGYKSGTDWYAFDANPEYGHILADEESDSFIDTSTALLKQVTLYALPTAAIEVKPLVQEPSNSSIVGVLELKVYRAIDYGETHFIRHIISSEPTEDIDSRSGGTVINTWGYATFGRNYYDEQNSSNGDVFNNKVPSMMPLGRFVLGAPFSVDSVAIADIRQRGGGVPVDFPMVAVETRSDGLDKLRGFLDLGIWEGKAIKDGGIVEVQISSSLLKTNIDDTDPNKFLGSEIYEIVKSQMPPGVDFEIKFVDNL